MTSRKNNLLKENEKITLSVKELAKRWSVPVGTIYNLINDKTIPILPIEGAKRILLTTVEEFEHLADSKTQKNKTLTEKRLEEENDFLINSIKELRKSMIEAQKFITDGLLKTTSLDK